MRKIILASRSKARQKLLKQIGLDFRVIKTTVCESKGTSLNIRDHRMMEALVINNALKKAKDAASRCDSGVVIGADTLTLVGNKIIGKAKDLNSAAGVLRLISRRPQWVYTGIAVVDIDKDKVITDYEKTKVYMSTLSPSQIKGYLRKVHVLDKAGSFDIQGLGGVFVERIEGCFYNVVGLPLAKLAQMLRRVGVDILKK